MTRRKSDKKAPSVTSFLSKISTPKGQGGANSPAKGLLGDISRADLAAVGRLQSDDATDADTEVALAERPPDVVAATAAAPVVAVEEAASATQELSARIELSTPPSAAAPASSARRAERIAWSSVVEVRGVFAGNLQGETRTRDVSSEGVFIETAHLLDVGDPVVLSFPLEDGKRLVVNGRVRWVTPFGRVDDPTPGMGIEFIGVDPARRDRIHQLLEKKKRG